MESMVELANANKDVVVFTRSTNDLAENCAAVFNDINCQLCDGSQGSYRVLSGWNSFCWPDSASDADCNSACRQPVCHARCAEGRS